MKGKSVRLKESEKTNDLEDLGASGIVLGNRWIKHFGNYINSTFKVLGHFKENEEWVILEYRNEFSDKVFMCRKECLEIVED
jgi:hypothetical protein